MFDNRYGYNPMLVIPRTFEECLTYAQQIAWLKREIDELKEQMEDNEDEEG